MLVCLSLNHRTADFSLLERSAAAMAGVRATDLLDLRTRGAVVVSTCNRVEAYLDMDDAAADAIASAAVDRLARRLDMEPDEFRPRVAVTSGQEALNHLFSVTSGLESVVVGEEEIAGQVRRGYAAAQREGATTPDLDQAFQRAARISREVRRDTGLGGSGESVVNLALELAGSRLIDWRRARALVVGTGRYAATTTVALHARGVHDVAVCSGSGRAPGFAARHDARAVISLPDAIADADLVITCTTRESITASMLPGDGLRRIVIDLGMPRNVDPRAAQVPGVDLLDLATISRHADIPDLTRDATAHALVAGAVGRYAAEQDATPAIVAMRRHVIDAVEAEIARVGSRGPVDAAELERTSAALRHLAGVLLHSPSVRAREFAAQGRLPEFEAALAALFAVGPEPEQDRGQGRHRSA